MQGKKAIIIGAGPAGLTAALELLKTTDIKPLILEAEDFVGGISRTHLHNGNRMDMGGHRFFSKSEIVMEFWKSILPLQGAPAIDDILLGRPVELSTEAGAPDPEKEDAVLLLRRRVSRIYYLKKFFDYPVSLNTRTARNLGLRRIARIGLSYLAALMGPKRKETSLEDFMINRFGKELYRVFFEDYTRKVWGLHPAKIPADWGAQRIKGISVAAVLRNALRSAFARKAPGIEQTNVETSLIDRFLYPKYGPGQLWEAVAAQIIERGGEIRLGTKVVSIGSSGREIRSVRVQNREGRVEAIGLGCLFSSMPVKDLIAGMEGVDPVVAELASGLPYRGFIAVGLLVKRLRLKPEAETSTLSGLIPDDWIYVQEREVKLGRLQVFNNWSPYLVKDFRNSVWLGLEYFCDEGDGLWNMEEREFIDFAVGELSSIGIIDPADVLDACRVRLPKAYPSYFGSYARFPEIRRFLDGFTNLYPIGRNGMHRYNNMDHSMLSAMEAVRVLREGGSKEALWSVNADGEYHESGKGV